MTGAPPPADGSSVVCALADGTYFHGAAVLLNSLIRHGFAGEMVIGCRAAPPEWFMPGAQADGVVRPAAPGIGLRFVVIDSPWHLTNLKAQLMRRILDQIRPDLRLLFYFDTDVLIRCDWRHFERWASHGVALALDMAETYMPPEHAFRREWAALAARCGLPSRPASGYVNGGFVGLSRANADFVMVWERLLERLAADGVDMSQIRAPGGKPEFAKMDQDVLNATVMASDAPLALLGQEAMDIFPSAGIMTHYMIHAKPWLRRYVRDALKGFPPDRNEFVFWELANNPVASFTPGELRAVRRRLRLARLIGHVRRRSLRE